VLGWRWKSPVRELEDSDYVRAAPAAAELVHADSAGNEVIRSAVVADNLALCALALRAMVMPSPWTALVALLSLLALGAVYGWTFRVVAWIAHDILGIHLSPFFSLERRPSPLRAHERGVLLIRADEQTVAEWEAELLSAAAPDRQKSAAIDLRAPLLDASVPPLLGGPDLRECSVLVLRHAEAALASPELRGPLLGFLERTLFQDGSRERSAVILFESQVSPLALLGGLDPEEEGEQARWARVIGVLRKERAEAGVAEAGPDTPHVPAPIQALITRECGWARELWPVLDRVREDVEARCSRDGRDSVDRDQVLELVRDRAEPLYRELWSTSSLAEKRVMLRLVEGQLVHPRSGDALRSLLRRGLVLRRSGFRLVSQSFGRFIRAAESPETIRKWEADSDPTVWNDIRVALPLFVAVGWVLIFASSSESLRGLQAYIPIAAGAATAFIQILNVFRSAAPTAVASSGPSTPHQA